MSEAVFAKIEAFLKKADPSKPRAVPYVFKFVITKGGTPIKTYIVDAKNLKFSTADGAADVTFTGEEEILLALAAQTTTVQEAVKAGKIAIEGEIEIAKLLEPFIAKVNAS